MGDSQRLRELEALVRSIILVANSLLESKEWLDVDLPHGGLPTLLSQAAGLTQVQSTTYEDPTPISVDTLEGMLTRFTVARASNELVAYSEHLEQVIKERNARFSGIVRDLRRRIDASRKKETTLMSAIDEKDKTIGKLMEDAVSTKIEILEAEREVLRKKIKDLEYELEDCHEDCYSREAYWEQLSRAEELERTLEERVEML